MAELYKDKNSGLEVLITFDKKKEGKPYTVTDTEGYFLTFVTQYQLEKNYEYIGKQIPLIKPNMNFENAMETIEPLNNKYQRIGESIGKLVDSKNKQYGNSFNKCDDFLQILYPNGVKVEQYSDMLAIVRVFDKLMRIANGNQGNENAWNDLTGYGILKSEGEENIDTVSE